VLFRMLTAAAEDVAITVSDTDVRCAGTSGGRSGVPLSPYTGDLYHSSTYRIIDHNGQNLGRRPSPT
jgi:hypothetical protein